MELIQIDKCLIANNPVQTVNARELHRFLEVKRDFPTWIKDRIDQYNFVENQDFVVFPEIGENPKGGRPAREYALTLDMAKELSMVERNEKGKQARQYFIDCERKAKQSAYDPIEALSNPQTMRELLLTYSDKVITLQNEVSHLAPKAQALDRIATPSDGSFCIRATAKMLQVQEKRLYQLMIQKEWIYRHPTGKHWLAYAPILKKGYIEHKYTEGDRVDGTKWQSIQVRVTAKGLTKLSLELQASLPC